MASLWFRIPCREPEAVARFWGVILGSEPEDIEGKGSWFIGANIGKTGASFDFYPAPEKMTDLSRLHLDVFTEDVEGTAHLAIERGGKAENELRSNAGRVLWRRVVDMEGNEAVLFQVDDLNAWWGQDNEGKPWPPAGTSPHITSRRSEVPAPRLIDCDEDRCAPSGAGRRAAEGREALAARASRWEPPPIPLD
jgi:hypothetical protein